MKKLPFVLIGMMLAGPVAMAGDSPADTVATRGHTYGPTLSAELPHPVWLDFEKRYPQWSFAFGLGGLSVNYTSPSASHLQMGITATELKARWHPFEGAFFLGAGFGVQKLFGSGTEPITFDPGSGPITVNAQAQLNIASFYFTPQLGWLWIFRNGIVLGFDLGAQLPFAPQTTVNLKTDVPLANQVIAALQGTPQYQALYAKVQADGNQIGRHVLPYLTVLRIGYFF